MATIPDDVVRVMYTAKLGDTNSDVAVFGFHMRRNHISGNLVDWPTDVQTIAEKCRDKWNAHITQKQWWSSAVVMQTVEAYHLSTAGLSIDKGLAEFTGDDAWAGTGGVSLPFEVSCCVTLYAYDPTAFAADRARKRGRLYLPPFATTQMFAATGMYGTTNTDGAQYIAHAMRSWLEDVDGLLLAGSLPTVDDSMQLGVLSRTAGEFHRVTHVGVDNLPDVQRRRQNKLVPSRYIDALATD